MNRQERRRLGIKKKDPMVSIKQSDIDAMKEEATESGNQGMVLKGELLCLSDVNKCPFLNVKFGNFSNPVGGMGSTGD